MATKATGLPQQQSTVLPQRPPPAGKAFPGPAAALAFAYRAVWSRRRQQGRPTSAWGLALRVAVASAVASAEVKTPTGSLLRDLFLLGLLAYELSGPIVVARDRQFLAASPLATRSAIAGRLRFSSWLALPLTIGAIAGAALSQPSMGAGISVALQCLVVSVVAVSLGGVLVRVPRLRRGGIGMTALSFVGLNSTLQTSFNLAHLFSHVSPVVVGASGFVAVASVAAVLVAVDLKRELLVAAPVSQTRGVRLPGLWRERRPVVALAAAMFEEHLGMVFAAGLAALMSAIAVWGFVNSGGMAGHVPVIGVAGLSTAQVSALLAGFTLTGIGVWLATMMTARLLLPSVRDPSAAAELTFLRHVAMTQRQKLLAFCLAVVAPPTAVITTMIVVGLTSGSPLGAVGAVCAAALWVLAVPLAVSVAIVRSRASGRFSLLSLVTGIIVVPIEMLGIGGLLAGLAVGGIAGALLASVVIGAVLSAAAFATAPVLLRWYVGSG